MIDIIIKLYMGMWTNPGGESFSSDMKKHSSMVRKLSSEDENIYYSRLYDEFLIPMRK